jgi:hypothetical protein
MREDDRRVVSSTAAEVDRQTAVPRAWVVSVRQVVHHEVVAEAVHLAVEANLPRPPLWPVLGGGQIRTEANRSERSTAGSLVATN